MRKAVLSVGIAAIIGVSTLLLAQAPQDRPTATQAGKVAFKALERAEIEGLGGNEEAAKSVVINNQALTAGLNKLGKDGWRLIAIEQRHTRPITGPTGTTYSNPATYIFQRGE
jgi:hypothetical protein